MNPKSSTVWREVALYMADQKVSIITLPVQVIMTANSF